MRFIDETTIEVHSGRGGDGIVSFARKRFLPFGGPDGGDGGNGGSVILRATRNVDTLLPLARHQVYVAKNGEPGGPNSRTGRSAPDVIIDVPLGTVVWCGEKKIADLTQEGETCVVARGGQGGRGNRSFASALNQAPEEFTYGEEGESFRLRLELKLIADVGIVGFPNAGKSTLLSRLSAARPKIADYPFTTMQPHLGIVSDGGSHELVMADIPGLIEGASHGAGLGSDFLRHIERCRFLLHLVDLAPIDGTYPIDHIRTIRKELAAFSPHLAEKPQILVGNKLDLTGAKDSLMLLAEELGEPILGISAVTGEGLGELRKRLFTMLHELRAAEANAPSSSPVS